LRRQHIVVSKGFQTLWWILKAKPLVGLGKAQHEWASVNTHECA